MTPPAADRLALSKVTPGAVLASKYRVEGVLGEGGMGVIVVARHIDLDEKVALKFLLPELARHPEAAQRFLREARAAAKIKGEHVVRVLDVGRLEDDAPFLVMEFLEGKDLSAVLREQRTLPVEDAVDWCIQAAAALAEAHAHGIVHRDIKPSNLFLTRRPDGRPLVKLLDFGISKVVGQGVEVLTRTRAAMGSTLYMSPEQMESSRDVDHRTDIYSLGVTLYELVSGGTPFQADSIPELCALVLKGSATPLHEIRSDVPRELEAVVHKAFALRRDDRHASMAAFAGELAAFAPKRSAETLAAIERLATSPPAFDARSTGDDALALATTMLPSGIATPPGPAPSPPEVRADASTPAPKRWLGVALVAIVVCALAAGATIALRSRADPETPPTPSAAAALPAGAPIVPGQKYVTVPKTTSAEAARAFVHGAKANYEGDAAGAVSHLRKAIAADPNLAVAHLWLAISVRSVSPEEARREFAAAWALRDQLSDYERLLARLAEPMIVPDPPDYLTARERAQKAVASITDDSLFWSNLAYLEMQSGRLDRAVVAAERGVALDPEHATAMGNLAHYYTLAGRIDDALAILARCLDLNRSTPHCLLRRLAVRNLQGACSAYEADARQLALAAPNDRAAATSLANALAAAGRPEAAVRQTLETAWSVAPEADRVAVSARDRGALAVLRGDLEAALGELDAAREWPFHAALPQRFEMVTRLRLGVLRELGRAGEAAEEARAIAERIPALTSRMNAATLSMSLDPIPFLLDVELEGGALDAAGRARGRAAWIDQWSRWLGAEHPQRAYLWVYGWAEPARTPADAKEALDALGGLGAVPRFVPTIAGRAGIGRTYLFAGDVATALPWLEQAAHSCTPIDDPIGWIRARFDLGRALEAKGDTRAACEAYGFVAERWGTRKPTAITGEAAKARIEALHCAR